MKPSRRNSMSSVVGIFFVLLIGFGLVTTVNLYLGAFNHDIERTLATLESKTLTCPLDDEVQVLYTISGDNQDSLDEFSASLKSTLQNAPLDCGMTIHIMTDDPAYKAIHSRFDAMGLRDFVTRNPIHIKSYDVESHKAKWQTIFEQTTNKQLRTYHTIGAMFRLFAFDVLPPTVKHVVYMDTDTAVLSNLADLWRHRNTTSILQWGDANCSGFGVFNLEQMRRQNFWKLVNKAYSNISASDDEIDDQFVLRRLSDVRPDLFVYLPQQWNLHRADNFWRWHGDGTKLVENAPKAAMIHMNGGSGDNKFNVSYLEFGNTLWVMRYYGGLPWEWVRYFLESQTRNGESGFQIAVEYNASTLEGAQLKS